MSDRTLVMVGTDALVRGYQSVPTDVVDPEGRPTNALLGVTRTLRRALAFKAPARAVAVIDVTSAPRGWPPPLRAQAPRLGPLLEAHGVHVVAAERPLDVVAATVRAALEAGDDVVVAGSDKRLGQLVSDRVWWYEGHKDVRYTPDAVRKKFGVSPAQLADWLALVGEDDLCDGVRGIGRKGAIRLLVEHGSLAAALADPDAVSGRAGNALRAALDEAVVQQRLTTLDDSGPPAAPLDELAWSPPDPEALDEAYRALGFFQLLSAHSAKTTAYQVCDTADAVSQALAALGDDPVALFALTADPSPVRGALVGLALSPASGQALYLPLAGPGRHLDGPQVLAAWASDPQRPKTGHDTKGAVVALARHGLEVRGLVGDSVLASHLADPSALAPHDLDKVARAVLHRAVQAPEALRGRGARQKAWAEVPIGEAGAYACQLADVSGDLWRALAPDEPDQQALLQEALALCDTLVRMELRGMPCDAADLAAAGADFAAINERLQDEIFVLAGHPFTIHSTKQLGEVLFEELGLPVLSRTKTGYSTAAHVLDRLSGAHPIVPLVARYRQLRRLQDSWVTALIDAIDPDGRVRSTFHPARSFSGRLVNSHPDLGRVPGRTPELARIRRAFRAPDGRVLLSVDYDQLGLYVLAHLTQDPALVEPLRDGADIHVATAAAVLDRPAADIDDDARQLGKVVNFATFAGQGASALALQLGVEPAEAKAMIARFFERYAVTRTWLDGQLTHARQHGWVPTLAGRRWRIRELQSLEPRHLAYGERLAKRAGPEGSVADVTRRGLLYADRALRDAGLAAAPLVQIHDEVLFEVPEGELEDAARIASDAMTQAFDLTVPLRASRKAGPTWADLSALE